MAPRLTFPVIRRQEPLLVAPSKPTPNEVKVLWDIDDQEINRNQIPTIQFYRNDDDDGFFASRGGRRDPAEAIREALAKALVFYYPLAGRLREGGGRRLMVECTGEGVMFVEADADIRLEDFGEEELLPPFPYLEELLYEVEGSTGILNCPLIHIQVTRLICGGFIFALRFNHTLCDAQGIVQFMSAIGEMARGMQAPAVPPVWKRELLDARTPPPPSPTFPHDEYDTAAAYAPRNGAADAFASVDSYACRSFFFGLHELSALRKHVPVRLRKSSDVEILAACLWKSRTASLGADADDEEIRIMCAVNSRDRLYPPLPRGYYGNAVATGKASASAGRIRASPLGYALDLVKKAKCSVTDEFVRSLADFVAANGRPPLKLAGSFLVSDLTRAGTGGVDFGWGEAVYSGPAAVLPGVVHFVPFKDGIAVPVCLPGPAMERFVGEIESLINGPTQGDAGYVPFITSAY